MISERIGILGGGQLGKMLCLDGLRWDLPLYILDKSRDYPAGKVCANFVEGDFTNYQDVWSFGQGMDILTIEIESVNDDALADLELLGKHIYPAPGALRTIKDKGKQKMFYQNAGIATPPFKLVDDKQTALNLWHNGLLHFPFVQKLRLGGYDGRGVQIVRQEQDFALMFDAPSVIEDLVDIQQEIAVIAARNSHGEVAIYDPVEMIFNNQANLVEYLFCPARISSTHRWEAQDLARKIIEGLKITGLLAVEFFISREGKLLVNEVAPRPHNSGHHTIEACYTSQFQQHLRAINGWPLGNPQLRQPALMMNILGDPDYSGAAKYLGMNTILALPGVYIHLYGKSDTKPYRKMGHVTLLGEDLNDLIQRAEIIKQNLKVIA